MAYSYVWPPTLPKVPQKGYSEDIGVSVQRTPMDAGLPKMRRRGVKPSTMSVTFLMTGTQINTLETFITSTIKGVSRFGFTHPRKGVVVETRIVPQQDGLMFKLQYVAPDFYSVALTFEILP